MANDSSKYLREYALEKKSLVGQDSENKSSLKGRGGKLEEEKESRMVESFPPRASSSLHPLSIKHPTIYTPYTVLAAIGYLAII